MNKTPEERIAELEKQLKELKLSLGLDDFSSKIYHTKDEFWKPTTSIILQNGFARRTNVATMTIASPGVVTANAHGMLENQVFQFSTTGALPTGVTAGTSYYVIATGLTANAFQFSASEGGAAVNTSGSQSGVHTIIYFQFVTAKIQFGGEEGSSLNGGGIFSVTPNTISGPSGYSEVDWLHATAEDGIKIYGQEVGGGGRVIELFVGLNYFKLIDGDGSGNNIETDLKIDFTPNTGNIFKFTADATAAGAYAGRIPIDIGGATKYLHYFDA